MKDIKFGIMCNGTSFPLWQANAIKKLLELPGVECKLLIIDKGKDQEKRGFFERIWSGLHFKIFLFLVYRYFIKSKFRATKKVGLSKQLQNVPKIFVDTIKKGRYSQYFSEEDVGSIKNHDLDFILRFGFGIIRGEILQSAKYGVWSFHHDDETKYRGAPPAFWEIYNEDHITGAVLQRLTDKLDAGIILKKGYFKTEYSYVRNRDQVYLESSIWPANLAVDIQNGVVDQFQQKPSKTEAPIYYKPNNREFIKFIFVLLKQKFIARYRRTFFVSHWNIGVCKAPISSFLKTKKPEVDWCPQVSKKEFLADPFGYIDPGSSDKIHILLETYPYKDRKGKIEYLSYQNGSWSDKHTVFDKDFHLSYPFILQENDKKYIIPESFENSQVSMYRAEDFTNNWKKDQVLLKDFSGIDTTIIKYDNLWWLFTSNKNKGIHHNLYLFYSSELGSDWTPHPQNPVVTDIRSARCAGTIFSHEGELYRPSMDYSEKFEGKVTINKIKTLSTTEYAEKHFNQVGPYTNSRFPDKIHTLSKAGNYTLIDGAKEVFIFKNFEILKFKLGQIKRSILK